MIAKLLRSPWTRGCITVALLVYLFRKIDISASAVAMVRVPIGLAAAVLALVAVDRVVMIARWVLLLRSSGMAVSVKSASWIYLVSSFVGGSLSPGVGADVARAWTLGRRTREGSEAAASVALDRLLGLLSIVLLGAFGMAAWMRRTQNDLQVIAIASALLLAAGAFAALWSDVMTRALVPARWLDTRAGATLLRLVDAVGRYRGRRTVLTAVLALSIVVQWLRIAQAWLLGLGLGIDVSFGYYLVFMPVGLLLLLLPISIAGFGLPQQGFVLMLQPQGVPDAQSFALSTLIIITGLIGNLPGAVLYLLSRRR